MFEDADIIDCIYEAAFIPELWPAVLERTADITGLYGGSIYTCGAGYSAIAASRNCQQHLADLISLGWAEKNIRAQQLITMKLNSFSVDHDYCTQEQIDTHPIYVDFLRPRGLGWTTGTYIAGAEGDFAIFSIDQLHEKGPIGSDVVTYLNGLRPHIGRACALAAALSELNAVGVPALLVSQNGRVQHVNSAFDRISSEILIGARDKIVLRDGRAHGLLKTLLNNPQLDGVTQSIPVLAQNGSVPLVLHVVPLRRQARDLFAQTEFVITVAALSTAKADLSEFLSMLYDLTATESRVARSLCLGETIQDISDKSNVGVETVRTHVKRILSKTGVGRQSELITRFSSIERLYRQAGD
jgi:DNA-binding CsgD family transcriptional regulator